MLSYDSEDEAKIISCVFDNIDLNETSVDKRFSMGSKWKDWSLLYSTVQANATATGRKVTLSNSIYIRGLFYKRPVRRERTWKFASGPLCKDYKWEIKIRSIQRTTQEE